MALRWLTISVKGTPQPQGSARAFVVAGRAVVTSDNDRLKPWRKLVAGTAMHAVESSGWRTVESGPVHVRLYFAIPRGKSVKRPWPTVRPDLDKLTRAVLDGLTTAAIYHDDSQVVALDVIKRYAEDYESPGVFIRVASLEGP